MKGRFLAIMLLIAAPWHILATLQNPPGPLLDHLVVICISLASYGQNFFKHKRHFRPHAHHRNRVLHGVVHGVVQGVVFLGPA